MAQSDARRHQARIEHLTQHLVTIVNHDITRTDDTPQYHERTLAHVQYIDRMLCRMLHTLRQRKTWAPPQTFDEFISLLEGETRD